MERKIPTWYIQKNGTWYGPFSLQVLKNYAAAGQIQPSTVISPTKDAPGGSIQTFPDLFEELKPAFFQPKAIAARKPKPRPRHLQVVNLRVPKPKKPLVVLLVAFFFAAPLGIYFLPHGNPIREFLFESSLRKQLKSAEMPGFEGLVHLALEKGLNFSLAEIRRQNPDWLSIQEADKPAQYLSAFPNRDFGEWSVRLEDGTLCTFLFDRDHIVWAVGFRGPSYSKIIEEALLPSQWAPKTERKSPGQRVEWVSPLLNHFEVLCLWKPDQTGHTLDCILVGQIGLVDAKP